MIEKFNFEFLIPGRRKLAEKINEIINVLSTFVRNNNDFIDRTIEDIDSLGESIQQLEDKAILKPDYEPEDVALRCIAEKGTFEWALIQMKKGKKVKRKINDHEIRIEGMHFVSNFIGEFYSISCEALLGTDWETVNDN